MTRLRSVLLLVCMVLALTLMVVPQIASTPLYDSSDDEETNFDEDEGRSAYSSDEDGCPTNVILEQKRTELINKYSSPGTFDLCINREKDILKQALAADSPFIGRPRVIFDDDRSTDDMDATLREFLSLFSNSIMHPRHQLFHSSPAASHKFIHWGSNVQIDRFPDKNHVAYFTSLPLDFHRAELLKTVGRVIAIAILNGQFMDVTFDPKLYEMILGEEVDAFVISDVGDNRKSANLATPPFVLTYTPFAANEEGGDANDQSKGLRLMFSNKKAFQNSIFNLYSFENDKTMFPMTVLCQGIFELIPQKAFSVFDKHELETLISGNTEIREEEWRHFTNIMSPLIKSDEEIIDWFWEYVGNIDMDLQNRLLLFVTGTSRLPIGGFGVSYSSKTSNPWFNIELTDDTDLMPTSDPYKNTLYLPRYASYEVLVQKLTKAEAIGGISTWYFRRLV